MLPPGYLEALPDAVIELIQEMEDAVLSKMASTCWLPVAWRFTTT